MEAVGYEGKSYVILGDYQAWCDPLEGNSASKHVYTGLDRLSDRGLLLPLRQRPAQGMARRLRKWTLYDAQRGL
jgi:hypothetical protein